MSYWVYLEDHTAKPWCSYGTESVGEEDSCPVPCYPSVAVDSHWDGGAYNVFGTGTAELNVTYNYSQFYSDFGGLKALNGKAAREVITPLEIAVKKLGTKRSSDYWAATQGNAGHVLNLLLGWARQWPDAVFRVS